MPRTREDYQKYMKECTEAGKVLSDGIIEPRVAQVMSGLFAEEKGTRDATLIILQDHYGIHSGLLDEWKNASTTAQKEDVYRAIETNVRASITADEVVRTGDVCRAFEAQTPTPASQVWQSPAGGIKR